jgi:hypothetical protein
MSVNLGQSFQKIIENLGFENPDGNDIKEKAKSLLAIIQTGKCGYFKLISASIFSTENPTWCHCIGAAFYLLFTGQFSKKKTLEHVLSTCGGNTGTVQLASSKLPVDSTQSQVQQEQARKLDDAREGQQLSLPVDQAMAPTPEPQVKTITQESEICVVGETPDIGPVHPKGDPAQPEVQEEQMQAVDDAAKTQQLLSPFKLPPVSPTVVPILKSKSEIPKQKSELNAVDYIEGERRGLKIDDRTEAGRAVKFSDRGVLGTLNMAKAITDGKNTVFSFSKKDLYPCTYAQFTDQHLSSYLDILNDFGCVNRVKSLYLSYQEKITTADLSHFSEITKVSLVGCKDLRNVIFGDTSNLQEISGLASLPASTFFCKDFNPDNGKLVGIFSQAKVGTIICTGWAELQIAKDDGSSQKVLTPTSGYRKAQDGSWELVAWENKEVSSG